MTDDQRDPEQHITEQVKVLTTERDALEKSHKDGHMAEAEFIRNSSRIDFQLAQLREGAEKEIIKEQAQEHGREAAVRFERKRDRYAD